MFWNETLNPITNSSMEYWEIPMVNRVLLALAMLCAAPAVAQNHEGGSFRVSSIRVDATATYVTLNPAPIACGGGDMYGAHLGIQHSRSNYQSLYAMVLTAYTTGSRLSGLWFSNNGPCSNGNWLETYMLRFEPKV